MTVSTTAVAMVPRVLTEIILIRVHVLRPIPVSIVTFRRIYW